GADQIDRASLIDRLIPSGVGRRRHVVYRDHGRGGAHAAVLIRHREGGRVDAVVVGREAEVLTAAVGDDLTVAAHHVPVVGPGIGAARVAEGAGQIDRASLLDRLIVAGIGGGRDIIHGHNKGVGANTAVVVRDADGDGVGPIIVGCEAEIGVSAVGNHLAVAADYVPQISERIRPRIRHAGSEAHRAAFVDRAVAACVHARRNVGHVDGGVGGALQAAVVGDAESDVDRARSVPAGGGERGVDAGFARFAEDPVAVQ